MHNTTPEYLKYPANVIISSKEDHYIPPSLSHVIKALELPGEEQRIFNTHNMESDKKPACVGRSIADMNNLSYDLTKDVVNLGRKNLEEVMIYDSINQKCVKVSKFRNADTFLQKADMHFLELENNNVFTGLAPTKDINKFNVAGLHNLSLIKLYKNNPTINVTMLPALDIYYSYVIYMASIITLWFGSSIY